MPLPDFKKTEINTTVDNILNIVAIGYYICLIAIVILIILMLIKKITTKTTTTTNPYDLPTDNNTPTKDYVIVVNFYKWIVILYAIAMCITTGFIISRKKIPGSNVLNIITSGVIIIVTFFVN